MAETKTQTMDEKEYVIPLRKEWARVPRYKRTAKSVKAIKEFIARHMRIPDRDTKKVKLDIYLNNKLFFKGVKNPLTKIKVKARKEGDNVKVELFDLSKNVRFAKAKQEKRHKKVDKKKLLEKPSEGEEKLADRVGEKTEEERQEEKEKEKSVEQSQIKAAEQAAKVQKHLTKVKTPDTQRKALKK